MKKMNFKKMLTMAMAAMMAATTMSISTFAEEVTVREDLVTVYTYNEETKMFDISYREADNMPAVVSEAKFKFSQNVTSSYQYLWNTNYTNPYLNPQDFELTSGTTIVMDFTTYSRSDNYYFEIYIKDGGYTKIPTSTTPILSTPTCTFEQLTSGAIYSFKIKKDGTGYVTEGTLS